MPRITTVGLAIAKSVFQVHGVGRSGRHPPAVEAALRRSFLPEAAAMPGWHSGLCLVAPLVARTASTWALGAVNAASLREAIRQTPEERCH
jgi:hypothetical protein